jgi:glutamine amidotransferase
VITIVDYGMGNVGSVVNMLKRIGVAATVASRPEQIAAAGKLLLPGVGSFDAAMQCIESRGLRASLDERVLGARVPVLGICLGMQLLARSSEEGVRPGLGWIPAVVHSFRGRIPEGLKVPHMGWNVVRMGRQSVLTDSLRDVDEVRFYFVHSYFVECYDRTHSIMTADYGVGFDVGVEAGNIFGVQFHPEKSHRFGMRILESFARV